MNLQHASEEPKNSYISPISEEQETVEMLVDLTLPEPPALASPQRIRQALRKLRKRNPVKQVAESVLQGEALSDAQLSTLLQRLRNASANRWNERMLASWLLGNVPLTDERTREAITVLGATVEKSFKQDRLRTWERFVWRSSFYFLLTAAVIMSIDWVIGHYMTFLAGIWSTFDGLARLLLEPYLSVWDKIMTSLMGDGTRIPPLLQPVLLVLVLTLVPAPISLPLSLLLDRRRQNRVRKEATASLTQLGSVEALPYLLASIGGAKGELYQELLDGIATLLPRLTPEDYGRLRSDTVPNLCYLLNNFTGNFLLTVLEAVGKIGDSRAITTVQRLAEGDAPAQVREAARQILPILIARREQENHSQNLLRASKEPVGERELLRPSQEASEEPETLLRPSGQPPL
ncbi:MAG: hypothetical protein NT023_22955 [Armatimonadetes bacterium]|nr:hypothetical protein [Armatimonadota bacterium]